eukprot:9139180-Alexandrium_andersonii.AAC.1
MAWEGLTPGATCSSPPIRSAAPSVARACEGLASADVAPGEGAEGPREDRREPGPRPRCTQGNR